MIPFAEVVVQLSERDALDSPTQNARGFEREIEACELRMPGQPGSRTGVHSPHLFLVDHLERVSVLDTSLLFHLDHEQSAPAAEDEIELVATYPRVCVKKAVAAKSVVTEGAPFSVVHAAS